MGLVNRAAVPNSILQDVVDSLRVRELIVVDDSGTVRARVGAYLPDAMIRGRRVPRGDKVAGVMLYDGEGVERGGYVTFDRSGLVAISLDNRGNQAALFAADSTPVSGGTARLWRNKEWVEMKADQTGPRFSAGRNGSIIFMQPTMSAQDAATMCSELKSEVAQIRPAPPNSKVLEWCRPHATDGECRKCVGSSKL